MHFVVNYCLLGWILFAMACGVMEAAIFSFGGALLTTPGIEDKYGKLHKWPYDIHDFLAVPRAVVGVMLLAIVHAFADWKVTIVFTILVFFFFPFFHDGALFQTRRYMDVPTYHWFAESSSKKVHKVFSMGEWQRSLIAGIGFLIWFFMARYYPAIGQ